MVEGIGEEDFFKNMDKKVCEIEYSKVNMSKMIHPLAVVDNYDNIGDGTRVWQWSHILDGAQIGFNCNVGEGVYIESGVVIGNNVKIKNNVALYSGVKCDDDVFLGPNCVFTNVINPRSFVERKEEFKDTIIKKGATIGANATVICGNEIGEYAMVGAGAVVTKDVKPYTLVIGNPAVFNSYICRCGCKLNDSYECTGCATKYKLDDNNNIIEI